MTASVHAREKLDGTVSGDFQFKNRLFDPPFHVLGTLDCITIVGGNSAVVGGVITRIVSTPPEIPDLTGATVWFQVWDNGEGAGSPPDQFIENIQVVAPGFGCPADPPPLPRADLEDGDLQVKP